MTWQSDAILCSLDRNACAVSRRGGRLLRAGFAFALQHEEPREQALVNGCNSGAKGRNLHEKPPVPTGGSSYLSAIGMPVSSRR